MVQCFSSNNHQNSHHNFVSSLCAFWYICALWQKRSGNWFASAGIFATSSYLRSLCSLPKRAIQTNYCPLAESARNRPVRPIVQTTTTPGPVAIRTEAESKRVRPLQTDGANPGKKCPGPGGKRGPKTCRTPGVGGIERTKKEGSWK